MSETEHTKWEVGTEVMRCSSSTWGITYGARAKVAKVYANGNVVLEGASKQQWRPSGQRARETGNHGYRSYIEIVTPELLAEAARDARAKDARRALRNEANRFERLAGNSGDEVVIAEAERLGLLSDAALGAK